MAKKAPCNKLCWDQDLLCKQPVSLGRAIAIVAAATAATAAAATVVTATANKCSVMVSKKCGFMLQKRLP